MTELVNKYEQALGLYPTQLDESRIKEEVAQLLADKSEENDTLPTKKFLLGCIELTTLKPTDNEESVLALTEKVNKFDDEHPDLPHIAALCVYPCFANIVSQSLEVEGVEVTCVSGNFPSSQALSEVKSVETALAIKDGATEIDIVMNVGKYLAGDYETLCDEIEELKAICGEKNLKVILETSLLPTLSDVKKASILTMYAGANFIKTNTGKEGSVATPEAAYVMCQAIKEYFNQTGIQIGLKVAGGIRTTQEALSYYTIVKNVLGEKWLTPQYFRIGASQLYGTLLNDILGTEEHGF